MHGFDIDRCFTVLVVERDETARRVVVRMLFRLGYRVLHVDCGGQALMISERYNAPIDLLLTEVEPLSVGGPELAARLRAQRHDMKVLYMWRGENEDLERHSRRIASEFFIHKPFSAAELAATLRDVLGV